MLPAGAGSAPSSFGDAIRTIEQALVARDAYTSRHSTRVGRYAVAIARELGLSAAEQREIALAAALHDVGKIGVPDGVLGKDGRLSAEEIAHVQTHPVLGELILRPLLRDHPTVLAVVRSHHERMDGQGYPERLRGDQIPLAARIVAVADTFDAMTSARPYRAAISVREAALELLSSAGTQLDGECVHAFLRALWRDPGALLGTAVPSLGTTALRLALAACPAMLGSVEPLARPGGGSNLPGCGPRAGGGGVGGGGPGVDGGSGGPVAGTKRPELIRRDSASEPRAGAASECARSS